MYQRLKNHQLSYFKCSPKHPITYQQTVCNTSLSYNYGVIHGFPAQRKNVTTRMKKYNIYSHVLFHIYVHPCIILQIETTNGAIPGPGITCELSFCCWISFLLHGFFFRFTIFLLHKNQHSKFQFNPEKGDKKGHFMECPLVNSIFFKQIREKNEVAAHQFWE